MILSAPVYVDSLPALVLTGLAHLAETKRDLPQAILPIIQSGFPEVQHTRPALEILANTAAAAGMDWAGHLAMGGGPMVDGANPDTMGNHAIHQVKGLDLAAAALDAGSPVPPEATDEFARIPITPRLYRLMGQAGWLAQAWKQNALRHMWDTPFAQS